MLLSALACMGAQAATITVNDATDGSVPSACTLRDAVAAINSGMDVNGCTGTGYGSNDTIEFDASLAGGTIGVASAGGGQINIATDLAINGPTGSAAGITLDGNDSNRIFYVAGGSRLDIAGVTFIRGNANGNYGGAILIANNANTSNHALNLRQCAFEGNQAGLGGAVSNTTNSQTLTIAECIFNNNSAISYGGAIRGSNVAIDNSTFSGNFSNINGGAISAPFTVTISNSTFSSNSATDCGGAISASTSTVTISNSTFSSNSATSRGGAVYVDTLDARHLTFLDNTAGINGQMVYIKTSSGTTSTLHNSIVIGDNGNAQCGGSILSGSHNLEGYADASGNWVASTTTCGSNNPVAVANGTALGTIINSTLADNGGPTQTLALPAGSPAIGAVDPTAFASGGTSQMWGFATNGWEDATLDQRGQSRAANPGERSVGAYEWKQPAPPPASLASIPTLPVLLLLALAASMALTGAATMRPRKR